MTQMFKRLSSNFSIVRTLILFAFVGATANNVNAQKKAPTKDLYSYLKVDSKRTFSEWKEQFKNGELEFADKKMTMDEYAKYLRQAVQTNSGLSPKTGMTDRQFIVKLFPYMKEEKITFKKGDYQVGALTKTGNHTTFERENYDGETAVSVDFSESSNDSLKKIKPFYVFLVPCGQEIRNPQPETEDDDFFVMGEKVATKDTEEEGGKKGGNTMSLDIKGAPSTSTQTSSVNYSSNNSSSTVIHQPDIAGYARWNAIGQIGSAAANGLFTWLAYDALSNRPQVFVQQNGQTQPALLQGNTWTYNGQPVATVNPQTNTILPYVTGNGMGQVFTGNGMGQPTTGVGMNTYNPAGAGFVDPNIGNGLGFNTSGVGMSQVYNPMGATDPYFNYLMSRGIGTLPPFTAYNNSNYNNGANTGASLNVNSNGVITGWHR